MSDGIHWGSAKHLRPGSYYRFDSVRDVPADVWGPYRPYFEPQELADSRDGSILFDLEFMARLVRMREVLAFPFVVSSGYRSPETNKAVGGHPNSAHMSGRAIDIRINSGFQAYSFAETFTYFGFHGLGIRRPSSKPSGYVHVDDIERDGNFPVVWTYP